MTYASGAVPSQSGLRLLVQAPGSATANASTCAACPLLTTTTCLWAQTTAPCTGSPSPRVRTSQPLFLATFSMRELQRSRHCWPRHCLRFAHAQKNRLCAFPRARVCKAASGFVRSRQHQTAPAQPTGASQQPAWDAELYCSSERAAVLALKAFQAPPAAQPGGEPAGSASAETSHHVLFSDSKGFACQMTVPRLPTPASAVVSRWQPHAGRCGPQPTVFCRLFLDTSREAPSEVC